MSKILKLDCNVDLWLSYSWGIKNQGICGHTFEVIDYYFILKDFFNVKILLCEDIDEKMFKSAIINKYNFSNEEVQTILNNTVFDNRPKILIGDYLLIVDGNLMKDRNVILKFKHIFMFACGKRDLHLIQDHNITILQDYRVYNSGPRTIDYKKKILFKFKEYENFEDNNLIYVSKNCREISEYELKELPKDKKIIAIHNPNDVYEPFNNIEFIKAPVENIWERFSTYYYTKVPRKFDCSPRFIAECKYHKRNVVYMSNVLDYIEEDKGLFWRKYDIENSFKSIELNNNDEIINILKGHI